MAQVPLAKPQVVEVPGEGGTQQRRLPLLAGKIPALRVLLDVLFYSPPTQYPPPAEAALQHPTCSHLGLFQKWEVGAIESGLPRKC